MTIEREQIEQRRDVLQNDINTAKQRIANSDKKKLEEVALINALQGALQQCDIFLKELDDASSDDGNDND